MAFEQQPPRHFLDDDKFMAAWPRLHPEIKSELLRMEREIKQGMAIYKDRSVGRPKKDATGFYGLELAEAEVYRLEGEPRKTAELEKARRRVAELLAGLAADAAKYDHYRSMDEELDQFQQYAEAQGKTLPQLLREFTAIEQSLRDDTIGGLFVICERYGVNPVQLVMAIHNAPQQPAAH